MTIDLYDNYSSELIIQPYTLEYGLYKFIFSSSLCDLHSEIETYVKIIPSGLVLSTLDQSDGMYGGLIEISRGMNQEIKFNPFINSYDLDGGVDINLLSFKYACQLIDSNVERGYPKTNRLLFLDDFKSNASLISLLKCFNSSSKYFV